MKHVSMIAGVVLFMLAPVALADFHVSPTGNDGNPGTPDRPVATLGRAIELSRALPINQPKRIVVGGGQYYNTAVALTLADVDLTIEAAAGEKPLLLGGVPLKNWQKNGQFYYANLPGDRPWDIRLLQVNGRYRPRARFPKEGALTHLSVFDVPWMSTTGGGWKRKPTAEELTTLKHKSGDLPSSLDIKNAEITVFHMWDESVAGIVANDPATQTLKLSPELGHPPGAFGVKTYCLWNIREGMTTPGQWYFDRTNNRIVYWPLADEDMAAATVIIPTTTTIIRMNLARKIVLRNLSLGVTTVPLVTGGFAAAKFDGAISLEKTDYCLLENLSITNVAGHAIKARGNVTHTRVENCDISYCGAGGVYVGGQKTEIRNNLIHAVGLALPSAIGINGGGKDNIIAHNEIHDTPYSAMDCGGENIIIEDNLIYDCMKVLHDGAAIYLFAATNAIIRRNVARDIIDTGGYGASAYYLDERSEGCVVEENLSVNVARPSHNHMARNNTIRNNVFIIAGDGKITFPRCSGFTLEGNVVYAGGRITFEGIDAVQSWSRNLLYSGGGKIEGVKLKDYSPAGNVEGARGDTTVADPLFVDLAKGDYRYKPDSPATKLGLKPIDVSKAGRVATQTR